MKDGYKDKKIVLVHGRPPEQARGLSSLPLGILYLGTVLKKEGYNNVYLADHSFIPFEQLIDGIVKFSPDFVGLNAMSAYFQSVKKIGSRIKERLPETRIIVGGPHASIMTQEDLANEDWIDFLVQGEGELTLQEVIKNYQEPEGIKGIGYWDKRKVYFNPGADKIQDLDSIPFPDLSLLSTISLNLDRRRYSILGSRGCPFTCSYCQPGLSSIWGRGVRFRSPENIIQEVRMVKEKYGINDISFLDDTFTLNPPRLKKLCSLLEKEKVVFDINARVDSFSEEIAQWLKQAGCERISFGFESGDEKILNEDFRKGITLNQIRQAFEWCHQAKIESKAYVMMASINETPETLKKTEALIDEVKPNLLSFSVTTPFKGTGLYQICQEKGLFDLNSYDQLDFRSFKSKSLPIRNKTLTYRDIEEWKNNLLRKRRFKFLLKYSWKTFVSFLKRPSLKFLIRTYRDFRALGYIG